MTNINELRYLLADYTIAPQGISRRYNALMWNEQYSDTGTFELHTYEDLSGVKYILNTANKQLGIITEEDTSHYAKRIYRGTLFNGMLGNYVIANTENFYSKTPVQIVQELYAKYYPGNNDIELIDSSITPLGTQTVQVTGTNLLEYMQTLLNPHNLTIQGRFNVITNRPYFEIIEGVDSTSYDPLTTSNGTVISFSQVAQLSTPINYAVVDGEIADDGNRVKVLVDKRASTNDAMRQIYVDARDVQSKYVNSEGEVTEVSDTDYKAMLVTRGTEKIEAQRKNDTVTIGANIILDIGEIRKVVTHNRTYTQRVTEVLTSYERNAMHYDYICVTI